MFDNLSDLVSLTRDDVAVSTTKPLVNREELFLGWLRLGIAVPLTISPLRLQNTRLHWEDWDSGVYFQGTLLDRAPSIGNSKDSYIPRHFFFDFLNEKDWSIYMRI